MFDWLLKIIEKKIDPCELCIVRPLCSVKMRSPLTVLDQYQKCELYTKYRSKYERWDNLFGSIHTGIIITIITLFCVYIITTFSMGIFKQYQLLFS